MAISDELRKLVDPNNEYCCEHCLSNKCKEWALDKGYIIEVGVHPTIKKDRSDRDYFYTVKNNRCEIQKSKHDEIIKNEVECTFKACEWILKEHPCNQLT